MWGLSAGTLLKPVCRWLLKRLGDLTLGDLDLDQLDLQLTRGTLQLSDLALNADFINAKVRVGLVRALPRTGRARVRLGAPLIVR